MTALADASITATVRIEGPTGRAGLFARYDDFADAALARGSWGVWVWGSTTPATAYFDRITLSRAGD